MKDVCNLKQSPILHLLQTFFFVCIFLIFQFHKGAIRTRKVLGVDVLRIYGFVGAKIQKNLQKNVDA